MKIKKGDTVIVIAGADKGKTSKVLHLYPRENKVMLDGVNLKKKHQRSRRAGQKGQIIDKAMPIHISNVQMIDPQKNVPTRVGFIRKDGKVIRIAKKSGKELEK